MNESYMRLRKAIGIIAILFSVLLIYGNMLNGKVEVLHSLSAYYWSSANLIFIGVLAICGSFLISYRGYDFTDKLYTRIGGIGMLILVAFPMLGGDTYLFGFLSSNVTSIIHGIAATLTFASLGAMSMFQFPKSDKEVLSEVKETRNRIYRICGIVIFGSLLGALVTKLVGDTGYFFLMYESLIVDAFGISWLVKGQAILKDEV